MTPPFHDQPTDAYGSASTDVQPKQRGTNRFAVAALVFGILPICIGVPSVVFGVVALGQIRKTGQRGKGLVIAGLALTGVWLLAAAIAIGFAVLPRIGRDSPTVTSPDRDPSGAIVGSGHVSATSLRAGDCLKEVKDSDVIYDVPVVPCAQPHIGEVFGEFELAGSAYPGVDGIMTQADVRCEELLHGYTSRPDNVAEYFYIYPLEPDWSWGERTVTCIAKTKAPMTGTLRK